MDLAIEIHLSAAWMLSAGILMVLSIALVVVVAGAVATSRQPR